MYVRVLSILVLALGAVLAGMVLWRPAAPTPMGEVAAARSPHVAPDLAGASGAGAPAAAPGALDDVLLQLPPAARVPVLRQRFEQADDLRAFGRQLQPLADAGDPEARWLLTRVHEYCNEVARDPAGFARDSKLIGSLDLPGATPMWQARTRLGDRCGRFGPDDSVTFVQLVEQRREAAEAGSLAAEAALLAMGAPLQEDIEYRRGLVGRVQASQDPDAFIALAPAMGVAASGDAAFDDVVAGTREAELAWQLAACRLGRDCSPRSSLMTRYCANGGICARDSQQDFPAFVRDAALPRQGVREMDDMVHTLVRGVRPQRQLLGMVK